MFSNYEMINLDIFLWGDLYLMIETGVAGVSWFVILPSIETSSSDPTISCYCSLNHATLYDLLDFR